VDEFYFVFSVAQRKFFGADAAKPKVLNSFLGGVEAKKAATVQPHQRLRAFRIGTTGYHACFFARTTHPAYPELDVNFALKVACVRKLANMY
jgi:hypothetical protein